ncbi:hypothetical protein AQUCO_06900002v1 [Aquilegia coerulea]|uniref:Uncharacterized protein n=1 Tax=Aquilegia coerulea TaxID=218851 RepID=A0A2G5CC31_AQUCA|nr:hypothetical protein AQUCO_06900002v1 [Aquilegia coerulea]
MICLIHIKYYPSSVSLIYYFSTKLYNTDNVFVTVVASIQYRVLADKASDAYYKLNNTRAQIQAYVFDDSSPLQLLSSSTSQFHLKYVAIVSFITFECLEQSITYLIWISEWLSAYIYDTSYLDVVWSRCTWQIVCIVKWLSKDVMDMVLITQYFDTMKEIGASSKSSSVFIPHGPGAVKDIASQIREGLLQGEAGSHH